MTKTVTRLDFLAATDAELCGQLDRLEAEAQNTLRSETDKITTLMGVNLLRKAIVEGADSEQVNRQYQSLMTTIKAAKTHQLAAEKARVAGVRAIIRDMVNAGMNFDKDRPTEEQTLDDLEARVRAYREGKAT